MRKAFTTIELVVAVSLLAVVMVIAGMVFKIAIDAQRQAGAIAEITRNFRAITDQINRDFQGLVKDGYLVIKCEEKTGISVRKNDTTTANVRIDGISFFSTGDFQSSSVSGRKSNISLITLAVRYYDPNATNNNAYESEWILSRNQRMLTSGQSGTPNDYRNTSLAELKTNDTNTTDIEMQDCLIEKQVIEPSDTTENWKYFSGGVGDLKIQWVENSNPIDANGIIWHDIDNQASLPFESTSGSIYYAKWTPNNLTDWPLAIKFTMTLYDSRGVIKEGKTFTHIVYIGE